MAHLGQELALGSVGQIRHLFFLGQDLGPFSLRDVPRHPLDADDQSIALRGDADLRFAPEPAAVLPDVLQYQCFRKPLAGESPLLDEVPDHVIQVEDLLGGVGGQHLVKTNPMGFLRGISVLGQHGRADIGRIHLQVHGPDEIAHVVSHEAILLLPSSEGQFGRLACGDVDEALQEALAAVHVERDDGLDDGPPRAVRREHDVLRVVDGSPQIRHRTAPRVGRADELVAGPPDDLFLRQAEHSCGRRVDLADHVRLPVDDQDPRLHSFEHGVQAAFALAKPGLGALLFREILHVRDPVQHLSLLVELDRDVVKHRETGAVLADVIELEDVMALFNGLADVLLEGFPGVLCNHVHRRPAGQLLDRPAVHLGIGGVHDVQPVVYARHHARARIDKDIG